MEILSVVNIILGSVNLMFAYESYKSGNTKGMMINGLIGLFCIWTATL